MKNWFWHILAVILLFSSCEDQRITERPAYVSVAIHKPIIKPDSLLVKHDSICIAAVGDIMLGTTYPDKNTLPADSGKNSFRNALNELKNADLTFGNLEGTLLDTGAPAHYKLHLNTKAYLFRMPSSYGQVLKNAGFTVLSLANNHIGDFGNAGRLNTMRVLDSCGIRYGGQLSHPTSILTIKGTTYGFCAFAPNSNTLSILDLKSARRVIMELKQRCDIVIVSFHGGGEGVSFERIPFNNESYIHEKRGDVHAFAHTAIDAGADVVLGNGPHVSRAVEIYKNRFIAYSLGNFCTYKSVSVAGVCGMAPLLKLYINKKGEFLTGRIVSYKQTHAGGLQRDTFNQAAKRIKYLTRADFPQSGLSISDNGTLTSVIKRANF